MKKKLTLLFALLCVNVMGWAVQYCGNAVQSTIENTGISVNVTIEKISATTTRIILDNEHIVSLRAGGCFQQWPGGVWKNNDNAPGVSNFEQGWSHDGTKWQKDFEWDTYPTTANIYFLMNLDASTSEPHGAGFTLTDIDMSASCSGGGSTPDPDPEPAKVSECIGAKGDWSSPTVKKMYYQIDYADNKVVFTLRSLTEYALDFAEVQIAGVGNYAMNIDATGAYTYTINNPTLNNEWYIRFLFSDTNFGGNWMSAQTQDANDANIIYYKVGDGTSTTMENSNMALSSLGASATGTDAENNTPDKAIDGDVNTRWSSVWDTDPQDFVLDLGQRRSFNAIQFVWYTTYTRTFDLLISDDNVEWIPIKSVDRTLDNADNKEETIQLGGIYAARYIKFHGTVRGGGYGHSFREFRVLYATTPVLTTYSASLPGKFCTIGADYQIAVTALDQLGNDFALTSEYAISPLSAGTITAAGVYTPAVAGDAIITISGGGKEATINVRNEVSANLAFGKTATAGYNNSDAYKANNADLGDRWGSDGATHYNNGANPDFQDWWYVDLGDNVIYDIAEIAIKWEGACPNDYDIRGSQDAVSWTNLDTYDVAPSQTQTDGNAATTNNYTYYNNFSTAIPCRYVGVWARNGTNNMQWGISMYDFQVFGLEHVDAGVEVESITLNHTSATIELGESLTLTASVAPVNATDKSITWSSDTEGVATVVDGVITTHTAGTARITATANDGSGVSATCELTVDPVTAKTWWGTATITWDPAVEAIWSITRNADKTLTYTVYFGGDASGKVMQVHDNIGGSEHWNNLTGYTDADRRVSFTTETTHEKGTTIPDHFIYFGGPRIELADYVVGSENERPSSAVESVEISHTAATVVKDETLQLSATVLPSFVENKSITWSSNNDAIASVSSTGLVTANAAGEAVITATSADDGTKKYRKILPSAQRTITVTAELAPATWYGVGTFTNFVDSQDAFAYEYTFTRATNHNVTLDVVFSEDMTPYISPDNNFGIYINDGGDHLTYDATTKTATYDFGSRADGDNITWRFYFVMANGVHQTANAIYTVGSFNEKVYACVVDEDINNSAVLEEYKGRTAQVIVDRSFAAGKLYTLVLPFDVDAAQTATKLPGSLTKLQNTIVKENDDLRINFVDVDVVEAGVPYLYTPSADVANPVFAGVTVSNDLRPTVPTDGKAEYHGIYAPMNGNALHELTDAYVLGPDQYLYAVSDLPENQTMRALRGYFVLKFPSGSSGMPRARVIFNSHETETATGVESIQPSDVSYQKVLRDGQILIIREGKTYNAQGQLIK